MFGKRLLAVCFVSLFGCFHLLEDRVIKMPSKSIVALELD